MPAYVDATPPAATPCLAGFVREDLLTYGVPDEWVDDCLAADEDSLLSIADRLPGEAAEALLVLATGGRPEPRTVAAENTDPFSHPDAQRRFRVMDNAEELAAALDAPWEKWIVFLHPAQRGFVDRRFNGLAREVVPFLGTTSRLQPTTCRSTGTSLVGAGVIVGVVWVVLKLVINQIHNVSCARVEWHGACRVAGRQRPGYRRLRSTGCESAKVRWLREIVRKDSRWH